MASPGDLVRVVAQRLGVPETTVTQHDRNLVVAGLRSKSGRGRSAAKMTPGDAANLIIAVAGSSMVKETEETVKDYAVLPSRGGELSIPNESRSSHVDGNPPATWRLSGFPIAALQALPETHTFHDALTALIGSAKDGRLQETVANLPAKTVGDFRIPNLFWGIRVTLFWPYPQASIHVSCEGFGESHGYSFIPESFEAILQWAKEAEGKDNGDLKIIREFSQASILAVGELLKN